MAELIPDSQHGPHELPADAVVVLRWAEDPLPPRWVCVGVCSGCTLDEALEAAADHLAAYGHHAPDLLATKVGGQASRVRRATVSEHTTRAVTLADVPAPAASG